MQAPKRPKVLVVDDEQVIADTLAKILDINGYDASAVYSGLSAVESARSLQPDLIISDVIMQDMDGIEACIRFAPFCPRAKFCFSPDRRQPPTCWKTPARKATISKSWPSRYIPQSCWRS